jgi:hypothetical protein
MVKVSMDTVLRASFSPHGMEDSSLIAVAGVDHHLSVLDSRLIGADGGKSVVSF